MKKYYIMLTIYIIFQRVQVQVQTQIIQIIFDLLNIINSKLIYQLIKPFYNISEIKLHFIQQNDFFTAVRISILKVSLIFMNHPSDHNPVFAFSRTFSTKDLTSFAQPSPNNPRKNNYIQTSTSRKDKLNEILQSINSFKNSQNSTSKDYHLSPRKSQHKFNLRQQDQNSFGVDNNNNVNECDLSISRQKLLLNSKSNSILKINQTNKNKIDQSYMIQQKIIQHSKSLKGLKQSQQSILSYKKQKNKMVNNEMNYKNDIFEKRNNHKNNNQKQNQKNINVVSSIQQVKNRFQAGKNSRDSIQAQKNSVEALKQKLLKYGININHNQSKNQNKKLLSPPTLLKNIKKSEQQGERSFANTQIQLQMMNSIKSQSQKQSQCNTPRPLTSLKEKDLTSYLKMQKILKDKQPLQYCNKNKKYDLNDSDLTEKRLSPIKSIKSINSLTSEQTHIRNFNLNMQNFTYDSCNFGSNIGNDRKKPGSYGNQKKKLQDSQQQFESNSKQKPGSYGNKKSTKQLFSPNSSFNINPFNESFKKQLKQTIQTNCTQNIQQLNKLSIKDFRLGKQIGKGKFGKVFLCTHIISGFLSAIKIIKKQTVRKQRNLQQLIRQIKIQSYLNQSNNVKMYGYFDDQENIYLLIEYCMEGQLYSLLKSKRRFQQDEAIPIIKDICQGLNHLHNNNIIHRDIKPENIVMSFKMAKLCDFGWSVNSHNQKRQTFCGTPLYVSPELLMGKTYDYKVDVWALGIMVYQLLTGKLPFHITNEKQLKKIVTTQVKYPEYLSENAKNFIQHLLQKNPSYRNGMQTIIKHNFLVQGMQRIRNKSKII